MAVVKEKPVKKENKTEKTEAKEEKLEDGWDCNTSLYESKNNDDDTKSIASAKSFMSTTSMKSLKTIHSARSIAKIAENS